MRAEDRNGGMFIALSAFSLAIKELGSFIKKKIHRPTAPGESRVLYVIIIFLIRKMILRCTKCCKQLKGWREKKN